ncbi:hypothetical protein Barb4_00913 [Bacteroidales bacterium Barb4]|nr:hypothetical protein Barb4_00913 [Bacteroidales bacterium Barb4]
MFFQNAIGYEPLTGFETLLGVNYFAFIVLTARTAYPEC